MYKKILLSLLIVILIISIYINRSLLYINLNPYTNLSSLKYITKPIKLMTKILYNVEQSMKEQGLDIKISYENAYGSGFLNNNPIPNDLDYMIGIDLGKYNYSTESKEEIAKSLAKKISLIKPKIIYYVNSEMANGIYSSESYIKALANNKNYDEIYTLINESLDLAISGDRYIQNSQKIIIKDAKREAIDIPYMLRPNVLLLNNYEPIELLARNIRYNKSMPEYLRGFMLVLEFTFTINKNGEKIKITIVPESHYGARLQLARKLFVSNIFVNLKSYNFIKKYPPLIDKEEYFFYRMLSFRRHLLEAENITVTKDRPVKLLKRIMQTTDTIKPFIEKELNDEISEFVYKNLSNPIVVSLNELSNVITVFFKIKESNYLYQNVLNSSELIRLYSVYNFTVKNLEKMNLDKEFITELKLFGKAYLEKIVTNQDINVSDFRTEVTKINEYTSKQVVLNLKNIEYINKYISIFNDVFEKAGYHEITAYWIDCNNLGIVADEFTKKIDDFDKFALENDLPKVNYKLINDKEIVHSKMKYIIRARYNPTPKEEETYQKLKKTLINDMKNFYPKFILTFY